MVRKALLGIFVIVERPFKVIVIMVSLKKTEAIGIDYY